MTYDPRGAGRSKRTDGGSETTVEEQADDVHRLIGALGAGPRQAARLALTELNRSPLKDL